MTRKHPPTPPYLSHMPPEHQLIVDTVLAKAPDVVAVYLFGSRLDPERVREDSDWDVAVLAAGGGLDPMLWFRIKMDLTFALEVEKVDLVELKTSDFIIRDTVLEEGRVLYCSDTEARIRWELASERLVREWRPIYDDSWAGIVARRKGRRS